MTNLYIKSILSKYKNKIRHKDLKKKINKQRSLKVF